MRGSSATVPAFSFIKDGYGRNYLVPRGLAIRWTRGGEKQLDTIRRARSVREIADLDTAREVKTRLESAPVPLLVRAGETGCLFGAVTPSDIVTAVERPAARRSTSAESR